MNTKPYIVLLAVVIAFVLFSPNRVGAQIQKSDSQPTLLNVQSAMIPELAVTYPPGNVIVVAKKGGNFTSIQAALDSIQPTAANRFLIWVGPGVYRERVSMKQFVAIVGAGEGLTRITFPGEASGNTGTVVGASNAELRFLTVESTAGSVYAIGIYNDNSSPTISNVSALATGGTGGNFGVFNRNGAAPTLSNMIIRAVSAVGTANSMGIHNLNGAKVNATNIKATATGGGVAIGIASYDECVLTLTNIVTAASGANRNVGIHNDTGTTGIMKDIVATAVGGNMSMGMYVEEASFTIDHSVFRASNSGETYGVYIDVPNIPGSYELRVVNSELVGATSTVRNDPNYTTKIGGSLLSGGAVNANGGTLICAGVYDENFLFYASACP